MTLDLSAQSDQLARVHPASAQPPSGPRAGQTSPIEPAGRSLGAVLALLTIFGPISMDLYLPVLPTLTRDLDASTSAAQLTVTACLIGLALGQLVAGPVSDRLGRRRPLLFGVVAFVASSLLCAVAPDIQTLVAARFVQGLAGAVGIVIAQAAGRDLYSGGRLLRYYGRLTVLGGLAAVVGPVVGGQLARVTDWRGTFVFLALAGTTLLVASLRVVGETLPSEQRQTGGVIESIHALRHLTKDRVLVGAVLVTGLGYAALFAYLSGATFVLQGIYGLSPQGYSYAFAVNSLGFMTFGFLAGRAAEQWSLVHTLLAGLAMVVIGAVGVLLTAVAHGPLAFVLASLFALVSGVAVTTPPATALALENHGEAAGSASALLGAARFAFGGLTAPLVGLAGADTAIPLGLVATAAAVLSVGGFVIVATTRGPRHPPTAHRERPRWRRRAARPPEEGRTHVAGRYPSGWFSRRGSAAGVRPDDQGRWHSTGRTGVGEVPRPWHPAVRVSLRASGFARAAGRRGSC